MWNFRVIPPWFLSTVRRNGYILKKGSQAFNLYEIAGEDRVFHKAEAWISRNRLYLKSGKVKKPVAVRYAWKDWAQGDLMHDGLPVSSFRSDLW